MGVLALVVPVSAVLVSLVVCLVVAYLAVSVEVFLEVFLVFVGSLSVLWVVGILTC